MLISKKNKEFLQIDDFILKCAIGKNGIRLNKTEADKRPHLENIHLANYIIEQIV